MKAKVISVALLSAALIWLLPNGQTPVNKVTPVAAKAKTVQVATPEKVAEATQTLTEQKTEVTPEPQPTPQVEVAQPLSDKEQLMQAAGIPQKDWDAVDYIVTHESSWRATKWNDGGSGAYGLCQALPASKMASAGQDYMTNPVTQLKWCHDYANTRYGGWRNSFAFWQSKRWW